MGERILGAIIWIFCGFGCGALFYGIGAMALKNRKPAGFWANRPQIKEEDVSDIPAYNRENARLWKRYSIPYWLCGVLGIGIVWDDRFGLWALILMSLACTVGIRWLISSYNKIWNKYKTR